MQADAGSAAELCYITIVFVQDAIAAGIKDLGEAQKVLRAMQSLEAVMQRVQDRQGSITLLQDRIAAAEQAGVWQSLIGAARALEKQVLLSEVHCPTRAPHMLD